MSKPRRNEPCPCGSRRKYKYCCHGKPLIFEKSSVGYSIGVPLNDEALEILSECREEFKRHFEREPGTGDPAFLARYLTSDEDLEVEGIELLEAANVDPAVIYAYKKTGRLLTESNAHLATGAAIQEWDEAIAEYSEHLGDPDEGSEAKEFDALLQELSKDWDSCIFALGLANDKFFNNDELVASPKSEQVVSVVQYQALCASKAHRTLRSIRLLTKNRMSEDALKLTRTIYESYLHIVQVQQAPESIDILVNASLGLRKGTHTYKKRRDGTEDRRIIMELSTSREIPAKISTYKMAQASQFVEDVRFFDFFYKTTSDLIHPSIFTIDGYVSDHGLDPVKPHLQEEAVVFSALVGAMILDQVTAMRSCPAQVAADCVTVAARIRGRLLRMFDLLGIWLARFGAQRQDIRIARDRCLRLPEN